VVSVAAFGVAALATVLATDATTLIAMRFLTGLGLGGAMPNAIALTAEFSPRRRRATMVMLMICGLSIGAALGGLIAAALIPALGWRSVFFVGGIAPLVFVPFLARNLPESVRFLVHSGASPARLAEILGDAFPQRRFPRGFRFGVKEAKLAGFPVTHLFKEGRTAGTLLLWVVFFASLLDLYFLSNWLPTVLSDLGASDSLAATIGAMLQVGGVVGTLVLGRFIDRFSFRALSLTYFLASIAIAAIGFAAGSLTLAGLAVFCAGFCVIGGQIAANALAAEFYPTGARSAGIGWTLGIGRIGSIVGPLVGGVLLGLHWSTHALFLAAAAPAAFGAMAALALNLVLKQRIAPAAVRGAATP
jgi:AAHS family 4-hydroxybenzoate transporter-like MFS transporter